MSTSRLAASSFRGAASLRSPLLPRGMATASSRIGDKQVPMSNLESSRFINYQRIEDNLQVVRQR